MNTLIVPCIFLYLLLLLFTNQAKAQTSSGDDFLRCLSNITSSNTIFTPKSPSFGSVLSFSAQNPRFSSSLTRKALAIVTPTVVSHVQTTVKCSRRHGVQIRVRSGGHDYEGLSYTSEVLFVVIDLINLRSIDVDVSRRTARIEAGATVGEVYYRIAEKSKTLGFPAGICPTMGVGGHFSGGGYGTILRKHGLAADYIVDAQLVNAQGEILDRRSMGEDLFWAMRGGGASSFGVVVAWKVELVQVPSTVTVFTVNRNLAQNGTKLVSRWQRIADKFDNNLFIRLVLQAVSAGDQKKTVQVSFNSMFLGNIDTLLPLMRKSFPELGLVREDCTEMSWIESTLYFNGYPREQSPSVLLQRANQNRNSFKAKSDFVKQPIPDTGLEGIWKLLFEEDVGRAILIMSPYGGKMNEISESETPFPHRAGNICLIQYLIYWEEKGNVKDSEKHISWMRRLYSYMTPYVSKSPREAYLNYRDLDIGTNSNNNGVTSLSQASVWGTKYFKNNFNRLVRVKSVVDPTNLFRNEQSIPSV